MFALMALIRREIKSWFFTPVFYSHCVLFSFFALVSMFLLSGFLEANEANLAHAFFRWHPWIFAMTAPVIGIRSWSEEHHCGLFEVLGTQPIRMSHLVLAKAIGAFTVVAFSLACTLPAVITVMWLGEPDAGVIVSGYLGSLFCGCAFAVVSQAVCAFMRGSIGAYVCSVALCVVLIMSGVTQIANIILATFPSLEWVTNLLSALSISPKYEPFFEGRIELAGVLGFTVLIVLSLVLSQRALLAQRGSARKGLFSKEAVSYGVPVGLALVAYVLIAVGVSMLPGRLDITEGGRFGLPEPVVKELAGLEREVTVRLFATSRHPQFGFDLTRYQLRIQEILEQVIKKSNAKVSFDVLDPNMNARAARIAAIDEVRSFTSDNGDPFMFGMVIESLDEKRVFDVIDPKRERHFIADLVQAIVDVGRSDRKTLGVLTPFVPERNDALAAQNWTGISTLYKSYDLKYLNAGQDWRGVDILLVHHPVKMGAALSNKLERYLIGGGDLIVMVDPFSLMSETFLNGGARSLHRSSLPDFVQKRGIGFSNTLQVFDFALATEHATENGSISNSEILTLGPNQFNPQHGITAGFDFVQFFNAGVFNISEVPGYKTVSLVKTSTQAVLLDVKDSGSINLDEAMGNLQVLDDGLTLMALQSSIQNESEGRLLLVADADWLYNAAAGEEDQDGRLNTFNSNAGLMRNMVDFLAGDRSLRELRMRSLAKRPLQKWIDMSQTITEPFRLPIAEVSEQISELEQNLELIDQTKRLSSSFAERNARSERQITGLKTDLRLLRSELSSLRSEREAKVQMRLSLIKWLNILALPLFVALFGVLVAIFRARTVRGTMHE